MKQTNLVLSLSAALLCVGTLKAAMPSIAEDSVTYSQDDTRLVTIGYTLADANAVVTVDVLTNGVSIGAENFANVTGEVNCEVAPGQRKIFWNPRRIWRDRVFENGELSVKVTAWDPQTPPDYMVVDLAVDSVGRIRYYVSEAALPGGVTSDIYRTTKIVLRRIPAAGAEFVMGSGEHSLDVSASRVVKREIQRRVTLTNDFYLAIFPTTCAQHNLVTGNSDGTATPDVPRNYETYEALRGKSVDWPTTGHVVGGDSHLFKWRSRTGVDFDLPTSAEWEFAARAGNPGITYFCTSAMTNLTAVTKAFDAYGWDQDNSKNADGSTSVRRVGLKIPNAYGLYDVLGNVWELCLDWTGGITADAQIAPTGPSVPPSDDKNRVGRGGSSWNNISCNRSAKVNPMATTTKCGYRLACPIGLTF